MYMATNPRPLSSPRGGSPQTPTDFVKKREASLRLEAARKAKEPEGDDFLKRLAMVENMGEANSSMVMPLSAAASSSTPRATGGSSSSSSAAVAAPAASSAADVSDGEEDDDTRKKGQGKKGKKAIPRHRRVHKEAGAMLGLTLTDHPTVKGVAVVKSLAADGACAKQGVRVGDMIIKINGTKVENHKQAIKMAEKAWVAPADGVDHNKDRLKFSLADRTLDFTITASTAARVTDERGVQLTGDEVDVGMTLIDNATAGLGVVVLHVIEGGLAHTAGIEVGHVIVSVDGQLVSEASA